MAVNGVVVKTHNCVSRRIVRICKADLHAGLACVICMRETQLCVSTLGNRFDNQYLKQCHCKRGDCFVFRNDM
jgi:hypothetical protein